MPVTVAYVVHGVNTPSSFYSQITNGQVATGTNILTATPSGHFEPTFRAVQSQMPTLEFTTTQLATAFGEFGSVGVGTSSDTDFYSKAVTALGTRTADASLVHNRYRISESLGYMASFNAPHNGDGTCDIRIVPNYDGTNEPIVPAGSLALAGTSTAAEHFGAGPVEIAGTLLNGVQNISCDFAVELIEAGAETEIWNTFTAIATIVPVFTITTLTEATFATFGLDGTALSGAGVKMWLRKKNADGTNVADAVAEHIKISVATGLVVPQDTSGDGGTPNTTTLMVYPRAPAATTRSVIISAASTIA